MLDVQCRLIKIQPILPAVKCHLVNKWEGTAEGEDL